MSLKQIKVISVFGIFALCFLFHFMYSWFPNTLFSIFFPVNESIWEHMKMLFTSISVFSIIEYILLKKNKVWFHNFLVSVFVSAFLSIFIFLIIYLPFYSLFGENVILNFSVLFITICISQVISYYILQSENYDLLNYVSLIGIIFVYIAFGILTYYPLINDLFYDKTHEKYGINTYNV